MCFELCFVEIAKCIYCDLSLNLILSNLNSVTHISHILLLLTCLFYTLFIHPPL